MATTYWEKIDDRLANDADSFCERAKNKYYNFIGPVRGLQLVQDWKHYDVGGLKAEAYPRILIFRAPPGKTSFGSVRVVLEDQDGQLKGILWDVFTSKDIAAVGIYSGIVFWMRQTSTGQNDKQQIMLHNQAGEKNEHGDLKHVSYVSCFVPNNPKLICTLTRRDLRKDVAVIAMESLLLGTDNIITEGESSRFTILDAGFTFHKLSYQTSSLQYPEFPANSDNDLQPTPKLF